MTWSLYWFFLKKNDRNEVIKWNFGDSKHETNIDKASVSNLKQIWSINGNNVNWIDYHASFNKLLLQKSSQVKNIWIPYGE